MRKESDKLKQGGFSLLELLVTLAIALIITLFSVGLYNQSARRDALQNDALALSMRLETAASLAKSNFGASQQFTQFRIQFPSGSSNYIPQMYDSSGSPPVGWVAAPSISSLPISLGRGISYGFGPISVSPLGQPGQPSLPIGAPLPATEIRFNTRGFPAQLGSNTSINPRSDNAVYLTDGRNYFAVTVNILGRVQVWQFTGGQWASVSR